MFSVADFLQRCPSIYKRSRRMIDDVSRMGPEELKSFQAQQIKKVMRWTRDLTERQYPADFGHFSLLTKDDVRSRPQAFLRRGFIPTSNKQTSGTSGTALEIRRSLRSVVFEQAAIDWVMGQAGFDLSRSRVAILRGSDIKPIDDTSPPFWRYERGGRYLVFSSNHFNATTAKDFHEALVAFRPDILFVYPSVAEHLVRVFTAAGLRLKCAAVLTSSEALSVESRERISAFFAAPVIDFYGQAERVAFAYSLTPDNYRFLPAYSLTEVISQGDGQGAEIVGTPFFNSAQILVRYRTGDLIELKHPLQSLQDIANGREAFKGISGRLNDVLFGPGGEILVGIDHIPRGLTALGRFQFVQKDTTCVEILVQKNGLVQPEDEIQILKRARLKLPASMRVEVTFTDDLRRTRAGKVPFVIHEMRRQSIPL